MTAPAHLPRGWALAKLPDLISRVGFLGDGDWVESKDQDPDGDVRLIQLADIGDGTFRNRSRRFLTSAKAQALACTFLEPGDLLIARMPDPLGRACVFPGVGQRAVTVVDVCIVRPANGSVSNGWLGGFVNSPLFRSRVAGLQKGSTRKRISKSHLCTIALPVPPAPEQTAIAEALDSSLSRLDEAEAALDRVERNLKRYRAAVLQAAVTGKLVPTEADLARAEGRDFEPASELLRRMLAHPHDGAGAAPPAADVGEGPGLPAGWEWAKAETLSAFITKGTTPSAQHLSADRSHVPYIKVHHLSLDGGLFFEAQPSFVEPTVHRTLLARSIVRPGDVLMNIVGPPLGKTAVVPDTYAEWNINQAIARFRPLEGVSAAYLRICLGANLVLRRALKRAKTTAGQVNLTLEICRELPIPVPPLAEQDRIVAEADRLLSVADEAAAEVKTQRARIARLRQSILKWAFEGKLVDQDPNDEPASVLLERIRAERAGAGNEKPAKQQKRARKES